MSKIIKSALTSFIILSLSACAFTSCDDKKDSSSKNYSTLTSETDSADSNFDDATEFNSIDDIKNSPLKQMLDESIDIVNVEEDAIFSNDNVRRLMDTYYPHEYLQALEKAEPEEFNELYDEAKEELMHFSDGIADYTKDYSGKITIDEEITGFEKIDAKELKFIEEDLSRQYEAIGLNPVKITKGYGIETTILLKSDGETLEELEHAYVEYYLMGDQWISYR